MPSFNRVTLMGNLTRDPQVKQLPTTTVAEFGLATNRKFKGGDGEYRDEVCYVDCAAFGKQAETIGQYCTKGRPLFVEGRLKFDSWDDRSGQKRSKLTVVVENFQFLGDGGGGADPRDGRQDDGMPGQSDVPGSAVKPRGQRPPPNRPPNTPSTEAVQKEFNQADIPF